MQNLTMGLTYMHVNKGEIKRSLLKYRWGNYQYDLVEYNYLKLFKDSKV